MTPLERAGKALSDNQDLVRDGHFTEAARAVIDAIREPTGELLDVIHGCSTVHDWRDMIDTILGEYERDPYNPLPDSPTERK